MPLPLLAARLVVLLLAVGAALLTPVAPAQAITRPHTLYYERPVGVGVVEPGFPVDYVGVTFEVSPDFDVHEDVGAEQPGQSLAVRFRHRGAWGEWQPVEEDGAQAEGRWTGALVSGDDAEAYQVRGVPRAARGAVAAAINTTDGAPVVVGYERRSSAEAVAKCKSRADWKADETIRTSTRSHADTQVLTVHHTATQNGDPDPDARVRAIYEYHVKTNGWADIGYNALIAEDGTVYEGRWSGSDSRSCLTASGTGWDFGHQVSPDGSTAADAPIVTGAHTGGYNTGNYGVALLGTFTEVAPRQAARDALVAYLAELADRHALDPEGEVLYDNGTNSARVKVISGHRDFKATECPGGVLYADLPKLRTDVAAALPAANQPPVVTITSPTQGDTVTVTESSPGSGSRTVHFAAGATDDATPAENLTWSWADGTGTVATGASVDLPLPLGSHTLTATATDGAGAAGSDSVTVTVVPTDAVASAERAVTGTVTGTYAETHAIDGATQRVTEVESGGKPSSRHSLLEHRWTVSVTGGSTVTLLVDATATSSTDAEGFTFSWSSDGGTTWVPALTVSAGQSNPFTADLPATLSGPVQIRVQDTDRSAGKRVLDTIAVDRLAVRSQS